MTPAKWRMLGDYLKGQKITPGSGSGIKVESSPSSGITLTPAKKPEFRRPQQPPFSILGLRRVPNSDPVEYVATLQEGVVVERNTQSGSDGTVEHQCNIGGVAMSTRPRPELTLVDGDFIALTYSTDEDGFVQGVPNIEATQTEQDSIHHQPASGAATSGSTGDYWVKLAQLNIVNGAPQIDYFLQSDDFNDRLWKGRNVGSARYIHKERDESNDTYDFRTLEQNTPSGRTYGKVIVDPVGAEFDKANDSIKFSAIAERATSPQVNVKDDGAGIVTIEGNTKDGTLTWTDCGDPSPTVTTLIEWEDGLITSTGTKNITAGCGGDSLPYGTSGDMLYHNGTDWVVLSNPGTPSLEAWVLTHDGTSPNWTETDNP